MIGRSGGSQVGEEAAVFVVRKEGCDVTEESIRRFASQIIFRNHLLEKCYVEFRRTNCKVCDEPL